MNQVMMQCLALSLSAALVLAGCAQAVKPPKRAKIYERAADLVKLPPQNVKKKWPTGTIVPVEKGGVAPFAGILITEGRAMALAMWIPPSPSSANRRPLPSTTMPWVLIKSSWG